jgi:hypothetical protein
MSAVAPLRQVRMSNPAAQLGGQRGGRFGHYHQQRVTASV